MVFLKIMTMRAVGCEGVRLLFNIIKLDDTLLSLLKAPTTTTATFLCQNRGPVPEKSHVQRDRGDRCCSERCRLVAIQYVHELIMLSTHEHIQNTQYFNDAST